MQIVSKNSNTVCSPFILFYFNIHCTCLPSCGGKCPGCGRGGGGGGTPGKGDGLCHMMQQVVGQKSSLSDHWPLRGLN